MDSDDRSRLTEGGAPAEREPGGAMPAVVVAAVVIAGLYFARPLLEPLAVAVLLSLMLAPAVRWLHVRGLGRALAVCVTVACAFVVILGLAAAVGDEVINLAQSLPTYEDNLATKIRSLSGTVPGHGVLGRATQVWQDLGQEFAASVTPAPSGGAAQAPVPVEIHEPAPATLQVLHDIAEPLLAPLAQVGLVVLFVVLILLKREDLRGRVLRLAGDRDLHRTTAAMNEAAERVSRYLLMQLAVGVCYGVPIGFGLAVIGIPNAPLWGVLGVALRFLPYIGGPLTAVLPAALAIAVAPGWSTLLWTLVLFAGSEAILANIVEPWLYGRTTGLSAVAVIGAAAFWTWLWGIVGLLLATPLTVCLVVLGRHVPHLQFLDILLGSDPVLSPEQSFYQRLLAHDPEEATEQAEEYARERSIEGFFDEVAIPALTMAQADSDRGALTAHRRAVIADGIAAMLDNLPEDGAGEHIEAQGQGAAIACLAGRNELDLAAAWLLRYLLRRRGYRAVVLLPDALAGADLDRRPLRGVAVVCLSLLSTGSAARARYLVRRIRRRARRTRLVIGAWGRGGADFSEDEAVAATAADQVVTSLAAAVADIEAALGEGHAPPAPAEPAARERV